MSKEYFAISVADSKIPFRVFYERAATGAPVVRPECKDLVCKKCGKLSTHAALQRGVPNLVEIDSGLGMDVAVSLDHILTLSRRAVDVIERAAPGAVEFFPPTNDSERYFAYPRTIFCPPAGARTYTPVEEAVPGEAFQVRGRACSSCRRFRSVTFQPAWFEPPSNTFLGAAQCEPGGAYGTESFTWLIASESAEPLRSLKGCSLRDLKAERDTLRSRTHLSL